MVKAEWGTKRACPKCNTRFYDLGNDDPVTCINCGQVWVPEPMLKSKQPLPFETVAKPAPKTNDDGEVIADDDEDLDIAEDAEEPDVDIGDDGDDEDLAAVVTGDDEEEP